MTYTKVNRKEIQCSIDEHEYGVFFKQMLTRQFARRPVTSPLCFDHVIAR